MNDPHFFGYGSLVNRKTHKYHQCQTANLRGWRRTWCHTTDFDVAILTVTPDPHTQIDGLVAAVPDSDWGELDLREIGYGRVTADAVALETRLTADIQVYFVPDQTKEVTKPKSILLSYLDVVVQGYLTEFGRDGVVKFFETTDGWDAHILDDRSNPQYPRHQELDAKEMSFVDSLILKFTR